MAQLDFPVLRSALEWEQGALPGSLLAPQHDIEWAQHMVLFFPEQHLTADEHVAFGRLFGELESHPNLAFDSDRPEFFELRAADGVRTARGWAAGLAPGDMEGIDFSDRQAARAAIAAKLAAAAE